MAYETFLMGKRDQVGFITLNRPDKMNTFSSQLARELNQAWRQADADDQVQVVVIKGAGTGFSAGIDAFLSKGQPEWRGK